MATEMEIDSPQPKELFEAAEKGDASLFKSLADQQLNKARALRNDDGRSLLHVAAASGRSEVIRVLSDADPSVSGVNSKDEEGWAPIHSAASCGHHEIVGILIEKGYDCNFVSSQQQQQSPRDREEEEEAVRYIPVKAYILSTSIDLKSMQADNIGNVIPPSSRSTNYVALRYSEYPQEISV